MAKPRKIYACSNPDRAAVDGRPCTHTSTTFFSECSVCGYIGAPDVRMESKDGPPQMSKASATLRAGGVTVASRDLGDVEPGEFEREPTNIPELDRVLGGGIVPGSLILLAAEPGAGKSTLSNQIVDEWLDKGLDKALRKGKKVGIVLGEESAQQVRMRFDRIGLESRGVRYLTSENNLDTIVATIIAEGWDLAIVDSIQTVRRSDITSEAGQPSQVNGCTHLLMDLSKNHGCSVILIGHSTKQSSVAGPQNLKHMVDVVLTLEGEERTHYRILRSPKNRFGSTDEIGIFAMDEDGKGLKSVTDSSLMFMSERTQPVVGSVICPVLEGSRVIMVEVQALLNPTQAGNPVRIPEGIKKTRLQRLLAVLKRRCGMEIGSYDVYVRLADGLDVEDPALDLAVCIAVASAYTNRPVPLDLVAFGEVSLIGDVRLALGNAKRARDAESRNPDKKMNIVGGKDVRTLASALVKAGMVE